LSRSEENPEVVDVSGDGLTFTRDYRNLFGISVLVPRSSTTDTFLVRNTGESPGFLRLVLTNVRIPDAAVLHALSLSAGTRDSPGEAVPFSGAAPCAVLSQGQRIAPGEAVGVTSRLLLGDLAGQDGQAVPIDFSIQVQLTDRPTNTTDCLPGHQAEHEPAPVAAALAATGTSLSSAGLIIGVPLVASGSAVVWCRRRSRIRSQRGAR
jgi:LPXTG-motif cell wall-anchored protein